MYYKRIDGQAFIIAGGSEGVLYPPHPKGEQSIAIVEMDGIYPLKGYSVNEYCTETMITTEGEMVIECDGISYTLQEDDIFVVLPGQKYRMTGKGKSVVAITPVWDSKQNHIVDEDGNELKKEYL